MLNVSIPVGAHASYDVPSLKLTGTPHSIDVRFEHGEHTFTSPDFELGTILALKSNLPLVGRLTFRYTYEDNMITVCGTDYPSADGMTLITMPKGMEDHASVERASNAGFTADEVSRQQLWNPRSQLMPGASQILKDIVRNASTDLIAALKATPELHAVRIRETLPEIPLDDYRKLCLVFKGEKLLGTYDEASQHVGDPDVVVWDLKSHFGGPTFFQNEPFANVIGSTHDPKPPGWSGSWIGLWRRVFRPIVEQGCSSYQFQGFPCGTWIVGGHVIPGQQAQPVPIGGDAYIIPICQTHNKNNNVYMWPVANGGLAVWLTNYML